MAAIPAIIANITANMDVTSPLHIAEHPAPSQWSATTASLLYYGLLLHTHAFFVCFEDTRQLQTRGVPNTCKCRIVFKVINGLSSLHSISRF